MAITQTLVFTRPDTSNSFHVDTTSAIVSEYKTIREQYLTSGALTVNNIDSDDGLTRTVTAVYVDLATYGERDNFATVAFDADYHAYTTAHGQATASYTHAGIDSAFTCTTVYTFPSAGLPVHGTLVSAINDQNQNTQKLKSLTAEDTVVTVVHQYDNSADFTANFWGDYLLTPDLHVAGVTRTISYAMV
jgi:hypothetical protein